MLKHISNRQAKKIGRALALAIFESLPPAPPREIIEAENHVILASLPGSRICVTHRPVKLSFYQRHKRSRQQRSMESCRITGHPVKDRVRHLPDIELEAFDPTTGSFTLRNRVP